MNNFWLKIGCYLTGYNYSIVRNSSEATARSVRKYMSAIMVIAILWGFIGYAFAGRYLHAGTIACLAVSFVLVFIVVQIERQIILSSGRNWMVPAFRTLIGVVMAVIGSVIIDQIIFREDIEKGRISNVQKEVNTVLPEKTADLDLQINDLTRAIEMKEAERAAVVDEISRKPFIKSTSSEIKHFNIQLNGTNGEARDTLVRRTDYSLTDIPNPKAELLPGITDQINQLRVLKTAAESSKLNARNELEAELQSKTGFLDELNILFGVLLSSTVAMVVWTMIFIFFMSLELLVLVNKFGEDKSDYESVIAHQKETRLRMLEKLS